MSLFRRQFTDAGAPPGAVSPSRDSLSPQIFETRYGPEVLEDSERRSVDSVGGPVEAGSTQWVDVRGLGDGEVVRQLGERFGLHPLALADVVNVGQRPKVERYGDVVFITLRMATIQRDDTLEWEQVSVFVSGGLVLTFQETHEDCFEPLRNRIRGGRPSIRAGGATHLGAALVDAIVDGYFPVLERYSDVLESFEDRVLGAEDRDVLTKLYQLKRELSGFRRSVWPLREVLSRMLGNEDLGFAASHGLHLRDTQDHVMQVVEVNESYRELLAGLADVHLSMVGQRTNDVMRVLTVVSAVFIPLTFLAGVYGMNFDRSQPANLPELGWSMGYPMFWALCAVIAGSLVALFGRLGWLGR